MDENNHVNTVDLSSMSPTHLRLEVCKQMDNAIEMRACVSAVQQLGQTDFHKEMITAGIAIIVIIIISAILAYLTSWN